MPRCLQCPMLSGNECSAFELAQREFERPLPPPPLGACMVPIVEGYLDLVGAGMHVLDVGCGSWQRIKDHCSQVGAVYEAIDTDRSYYGRETVATRLENLGELSFPDETFDVVIGNQTMEHWAENGCSLAWGLYQCFRVCKPGGKVLLNVPIHFHGTKTFMLGDLDRLARLFAPFSGRVVFEKWGDPSSPLPDVFPFPGYWKLRNKPAYVLDIQATKDLPLPTGYRASRGATGRVAQLLHYPLSYNLYRVVRNAVLPNKARQRLEKSSRAEADAPVG